MRSDEARGSIRYPHRESGMLSLPGDPGAAAESSERGKDLELLSHLCARMNEEGYSVSDLCEEIAERVPGRMQYPQSCWLRVVLGSFEYRSEGSHCRSARSPWYLIVPVVADGQRVGILELGYSRPYPPMAEGPFLAEECELVRLLAGLLGRYMRRKRLEERTLEKERYYHSLFETNRIPMLILEPASGRILEANREAAHFFAWSVQELAGRRVEVLLVPESEQLDMAMQRALLEGQSSVRLRRRLRNGSDREVELSLAPLSRGAQRVLSVAVYDVTAAERSEEALRRLEAIVEATDDAIITKDVNGTITSWNRGAEGIYGYSRDEAVGRGIELIVPPEKREELERIMDSIRQGRRENSLFTERICKGGGRVPVSVSVTPLTDDEGRVIGASTIGRDMSRRIEIERNLQRRLDEKEILLGELHHRVKNNLNIIASLLRLHLDTLETDTGSVTTLRSCLNRVYAMAFVHESMYSREHCTSVRIGRYLELLLQHLAASFPHLEQVRIERYCSGLELNIAQAIPLGIILNELLSNVALHAGTPETELQCIRVAVTSEGCSEGNRIRFKVEDDGRGLPEELNPAESGSLGLVLVRALADQLGGQLSWRRGGGTTVEGSFINDPEFHRRREASIAVAEREGEEGSW